MFDIPRALSRRNWLRTSAALAACYSVRGLYAEELLRTPKQIEGPFYPDQLPLDTDNDLLVLNDSLTPAVGEVTYLSGKILDLRGEPLRNAVVEIWQCDQHGAYLHSRSGNRDKRDANFQGFGRFTTGSTGEYLFRTIKPVPYPGRTPHIHFAVKAPRQERFVTQCYIAGHAQNDRDGIFRNVGNEAARQAVSATFSPLPSSRMGELTAKFDIILGMTPPE